MQRDSMLRLVNENDRLLTELVAAYVGTPDLCYAGRCIQAIAHAQQRHVRRIQKLHEAEASGAALQHRIARVRSQSPKGP